MTYAINRRQLLKRPDPVNFRAILMDIRRAGYGTSDICFTLNVARGTLWHWEQGKCPNHHDGQALLAFHAETQKPAHIRAHIEESLTHIRVA